MAVYVAACGALMGYACIVCLPDIAVVDGVVSCLTVNFDSISEGCRPASCAVASYRTLNCTAYPLDFTVGYKESVALAGGDSVNTCVGNAQIVDVNSVATDSDAGALLVHLYIAVDFAGISCITAKVKLACLFLTLGVLRGMPEGKVVHKVVVVADFSFCSEIEPSAVGLV